MTIQLSCCWMNAKDRRYHTPDCRWLMENNARLAREKRLAGEKSAKTAEVSVVDDSDVRVILTGFVKDDAEGNYYVYLKALQSVLAKQGLMIVGLPRRV